MKVFYLAGCSLAFALLCVIPAKAGPIMTVGLAPPTTDLLVSHPVLNTSFAEGWGWIGNTGNDHRDIGQSFLIPGSSDVRLDKITLWARDVGAGVPGAAFTVEIWTVDDPFDGSGNLLVNSQSGVLPTSGITSSNRYWTFDIDNVPLSAGQHYAFMLAFDSGPVADRRVTFVEDFNAGYTDGRWLARNGTPTNWSSITHDAAFFLQGSPITIPEPSTLLLGGLATCLGMVSRRRTSRRPRLK